MAIVLSGSTGIDAGSLPVSNCGNTEVEGNLNLSGVGTRITGDFSNVTESNKTAFQTSTINSATVVGIAPNGTSTIAVSRIFNSSDVNNSSNGNFRISSTEVGVWSSKFGTGSYLPLCFYTSDTERMRIDTAGNVLVTNSTGGLGYGTGSGGTVTQLTSKSTSVTLNKPTGQIITSNASLAAGAYVEFYVNNSLVTINDEVIINTSSIGGIGWKYDISAKPFTGGFYCYLTNTRGGTSSDAVYINFSINKGAIS